MIERVHATALFALYQLSIAIGIMLLPLAVAVQQTAGRSLPIHRMIELTEDRYEGARPE